MKKWMALALLVPALAATSWAQSAPVDPAQPQMDAQLANLKIWVEIVGGALTALVACVGIPAAFLQFSKTRAELKKLRLETEKMTLETAGQRNEVFESQALRVSVSDSPGTNINIETAAGLSGPVLVMMDFVISWIIYAAFGVLQGLLPLSGYLARLISTLLNGVVLVALFLPVYFNGQQARLLLREVADARRNAEAERNKAGA